MNTRSKELQEAQAFTFREAHHKGPLVLPNAWDAASAMVVASAGAHAIATTSAGISWGKGASDGQALTRSQMVTELQDIVAATQLPVSADIESGYGAGTIEDLVETIRAVLAAGVVGINLEDTPGEASAAIRTIEDQCARIRAARETAMTEGVDLFINARTDIYLFAIGAPEARFTEVVRRAEAYLEAGADGIFVPGVADLQIIKELVQAIPAPLNIMAGPGAPSVDELAAVGVARISLGPALMLAALGFLKRSVEETLTAGTYSFGRDALSFQEVNDAFAV